MTHNSGSLVPLISLFCLCHFSFIYSLLLLHASHCLSVVCNLSLSINSLVPAVPGTSEILIVAGFNCSIFYSLKILPLHQISLSIHSTKVEYSLCVLSWNTGVTMIPLSYQNSNTLRAVSLSRACCFAFTFSSKTSLTVRFSITFNFPLVSCQSISAFFKSECFVLHPSLLHLGRCLGRLHFSCRIKSIWILW